ncbi:hypothetical protein SARC_05391 [Sphaeroforma arctica JP610]|uniref:Cytosolic endo-beta-N-acetylglucosaminidase TIM barrel domain-containing protein n=1 Tax=Sphaeroforma arctica JP610 TaxID=667725 RepID=A0A0L0FZP7_9EUKA|nr:hypothetical protein SARC_05391 [Sphaeroforma arctica JP610]KNC82327.1 hypothetical protein SARC_05391 [Sphaeroforma arctica JP610]|eukprot:XP_014156229.1 hypothetical protein SARC_05391 [Sphaeroforma arctica JP610]
MFIVKCLILPLIFEKWRITRVYDLASKLHRETLRSLVGSLRSQSRKAEISEKPLVRPLMHNHWLIDNDGPYRIAPQNSHAIAEKAPERLPIGSIDELLDKAKHWINELNTEDVISISTSELELTSRLVRNELGVPVSSTTKSNTTAEGFTSYGLSETTNTPPRVPRTIVCHDYRGGYCATERYFQGSDEQTPYNIYHWQYIDMYIYFSHHLVTIPPPSLIAQCRTNGVACLGTFITEWEKGWEICASVLCTREGAKDLAVALATACVKYGFDGWLINIENPLEEEFIDNLLYFVKVLTEVTHKLVDGGQVIWYDSVTIFGRLKWQNELNYLNDIFMRESDGIFLNYAWTDEGLAASRTIAEAYAPVPRGKETITHDGRSSDVYTGIDVYGRGCFGGGGFNSKLALEKIATHGLSTALFAPGWVHENLPNGGYDDNQSRFWTDLLPYLQFRPLRTSQLPFRTNFNMGTGRGYWLAGKDARDTRIYTSSSYATKATGDTQSAVVSEDLHTRSTDRGLRCECAKRCGSARVWADIGQQSQCVGVRSGWEAVSARSGLRVRVAQCDPSAAVGGAAAVYCSGTSGCCTRGVTDEPTCKSSCERIHPDKNHIHAMGGAYEGPCVLEIMNKTIPTEGTADDIRLDIGDYMASEELSLDEGYFVDQGNEDEPLLSIAGSTDEESSGVPNGPFKGAIRIPSDVSASKSYNVRVLDCELDINERYVVSIIYAVRNASGITDSLYKTTKNGSDTGTPILDISVGVNRGCVDESENISARYEASNTEFAQPCTEHIKKSSLGVGDWQQILMEWQAVSLGPEGHQTQSGEPIGTIRVGIDVLIVASESVGRSDWCVVVGEVSVQRKTDVHEPTKHTVDEATQCTHILSSSNSPIEVHDVLYDRVIYQTLSTPISSPRNRASDPQATDLCDKTQPVVEEMDTAENRVLLQLTCTLQWGKIFTCGRTCTCVAAKPMRYRVWACTSQVCNPTPPLQLYLGETSECRYTILGLCVQPPTAPETSSHAHAQSHSNSMQIEGSVKEPESPSASHNTLFEDNEQQNEAHMMIGGSDTKLPLYAGVWFGVYPVCALGHSLGGSWVHV